jgi:hypothetical protein
LAGGYAAILKATSYAGGCLLCTIVHAFCITTVLLFLNRVFYEPAGTFFRRIIMPFHDGTGPAGLGPKTGRRGGGYGFGGSGFSPRRIGFLGALVPVAVAVVRDLANPYGFLRTTGRKLIERKPDNHGKPVNASFTILEEKNSKGFPPTERMKKK